MIKDIVKQIIADQAVMNATLVQLKPFLKDKNIPLEERWQAFEAVAQFLPKESYGHGYIEELDDNLTMYDDLYIDRHQTVTYVNMYERILELAEENEYEQEQIDDWRELVLSDAYGSFTYDW